MAQKRPQPKVNIVFSFGLHLVILEEECSKIIWYFAGYRDVFKEDKGYKYCICHSCFLGNDKIVFHRQYRKKDKVKHVMI